MRKHSGNGADGGLAEVTARLAALQLMTVGQLADEYQRLFGTPTRSRNRDFLRKRLAWRIQELAEGGLSDRSLSKILELGDSVPERWLRRATPTVTVSPPPRDIRLPQTGTVLTRSYGGQEHKVTVVNSGFEYAGETFRSLSAIAKRITGQQWNGYAFFGLTRSQPGAA